MKRATWILVLLCATSPLFSAETLSTPVNLAFPAVQEGGGARAIALGSTYVGIAEGSSTLLWNPAGLAQLEDPELAVHHQSALLGSLQEIAILGLPIGSLGGIAAALTYGDQGPIEGRDALGAPTSAYSAKAMGAALGWGFNVDPRLSLGLGLKWDQQSVAGTDLSAPAADFGARWNASQNLSFGVAYTNFGPAVKGYLLAQGLRLGLSNYWNKGQDFQWLLALSGEALTHSDNSVHLGLEHTLYHTLSLRAGYGFKSPSPDQTEGLEGWTLGAGVLVHRLSLDYAYVPVADLGSTQRLSLTYAFGGRADGDCLHSTPGPNETVLIFTDLEFAYTGDKESEVLSEAAVARLHQGLRHISDVCGASLRISGSTTLTGDSASHLKVGPRLADAEELRLVGERRIALVKAYVHKHMSAARINSLVSPYSEAGSKGSPTAIFQFTVY